MADIRFFFPYKKINLRQRGDLKDFIAQLFKKEKRALQSLRYIFCSDEYLLTINAQYLNHHFYTDIVTFELGSKKETDGEIYISLDSVKENAARYNVSFRSELHRVIFHGALHLCGYKDKLKAEKETMRAKEDRYLQQYFYK